MKRKGKQDSGRSGISQTTAIMMPFCTKVSFCQNYYYGSLPDKTQGVFIQLILPATRTCHCGNQNTSGHLYMMSPASKVTITGNDTSRFISLVLSTAQEPPVPTIHFYPSKSSRGKKKNLLVHPEIHSKIPHLFPIPLHSPKCVIL